LAKAGPIYKKSTFLIQVFSLSRSHKTPNP
jgi:hypothetical protein